MHNVLSAFLTMAVLAACPSAHADTVDLFTLTGNGLYLSFSIPEAPTPVSADPNYGFFLNDVGYVENGTALVASQALFPTTSINGGFILFDRDVDLIENFSFYGPQVFTGDPSTPTFQTGSFSLQALFCPNSPNPDDPIPAEDCGLDPYRLEITEASAPTPEPSSLLLIGTGAAGAIGMIRRRILA